MKILIYGDSNTWGYVPDVNGYTKDAVNKQYPIKNIWWYSLAEKYDVIVDGVMGRTINSEHPYLEGRNSTSTILQNLNSVHHVDLVILQLGTNDCKKIYNLSAEDIANQMREFIKIIQHRLRAKIILISPSLIKEGNRITDKYYKGGEEKSNELDGCYEKLAKEIGVEFISGLNLPVGEDGEHLTVDGHRMLSTIVRNVIDKMYSKNNKR